MLSPFWHSTCVGFTRKRHHYDGEIVLRNAFSSTPCLEQRICTADGHPRDRYPSVCLNPASWDTLRAEAEACQSRTPGVSFLRPKAPLRNIW